MPAHRARQPPRHRAAPATAERPGARHRQQQERCPGARHATAFETVATAMFIAFAQAPAVERATALASPGQTASDSTPDHLSTLGSAARLTAEVIAPPRLDPRIAATRAARSAQRDPRGAGRQLAAARGWTGGQWTWLDRLWLRESRWNTRAENPSSGAYGIPQALPGSKMSSVARDWRTNPITQIRWGLGYIKGRYGSPCGAWAHSESHGWY